MDERNATPKETSLEAKEPTGGCPETPPWQAKTLRDASDVRFRHSGWANQRIRVQHALDAIYVCGSRPTHFAECGSAAWVYRSPTDPDAYLIKANYCHDRWCHPCQNHRVRLIRANLDAYCRGKELRFVTLTIRGTDRPLAKSLEHLKNSFMLLRKTVTWTMATAGGIGFVEIKKSASSGYWHPHLHLIVQGKFMSQKRLSDTWHAVTKDSQIVDIRLVRKPDQVLHYVTKYVTKPVPESILNSRNDLQEAIVALNGHRTMTTFGSWYGIDFQTKPTTTDWEPVAPLSELLYKARKGDSRAFQIINDLRSNDKCLTQELPLFAGTPPYD
jgi:hypothetical protein